MSDEKVLTKEIAEQFMADVWSVDLSDFAAIEDDAAEIVGKAAFIHGVVLYGLVLSELKSISVTGLSHLLRHPQKMADLFCNVVGEYQRQLDTGTSTKDTESQCLAVFDALCYAMNTGVWEVDTRLVVPPVEMMQETGDVLGNTILSNKIYLYFYDSEMDEYCSEALKSYLDLEQLDRGMYVANLGGGDVFVTEGYFVPADFLVAKVSEKGWPGPGLSSEHQIMTLRNV